MTLFQDRHVTVLGLARSGEAAANLLVNLGAHVLVSDQKSEEQLSEAVGRLAGAHPEIEFHLGGHPDEIIENADFVVISPGIPSDIPILKKARERGIPVIGEVELAYRVCRAPIIAITGTKGKSTTSTLLGKILGRIWKGNTVVAGNIGAPVSQYVLDLTASDLLVLEVSSFQLETTVDFAPAVSAILNIDRDHLDRYTGAEDYAAAKYRIFAAQTEDDYTILNADDPLTAACASRTRAEVVLFSSRQRLDDGVFLEDGKIVARRDGSQVEIIDSGKVKIPGRHNILNALAATAVSLLYGASPAVIAEELQNFSGLEHALEFVDTIRGVKFINDSKSTNVFSLKAALESLNGNTILIMGGRDKGNDYSPLEPIIPEKVSHLIIIGESADKIQDAIGGYTKVSRAGSMKEAVSLAYSVATSGETILMSPACASFDMFRDYAERGVIFKKLVRQIADSERSKKRQI